MTQGKTAVIAPELISVEEVAQMLNIGESTVYKWDALGIIGPKSMKVGRRKLWSCDALRRWAAASCPRREKWLDMENRRR